MTEKRYKAIPETVEYKDTVTGEYLSPKFEKDYYKVLDLLNENEQLKKELKVYRKVASCGNCHYHNYDWFDDGDEFEVCDKGNDVTERICEEWREL